MTFRTGAATPTWSRGPAVGLAVQIVVLATLGATTGLTVAGWLAGTAYGICLCGFLAYGLHRSGLPAMGPANLVTLTRALMVGGVTAMVVSAVERPVHQAALVTLIGVALALDGVDGQVARRTGSTTKLGARFDMEVDSFLVLVLSVFVGSTLGWWTVLIGAYRYLFVAASWLRPWLTAPLPARFSRKVVAATQGVVLVVATAGLLPGPAARAGLAAALAVLTWSFAKDARWLWRAEQLRRVAAVRPNLPIVPGTLAVTFDPEPVHRTPATVG
ncbi:MAG TPA: CDP-alcohol phosphatidyltransferase family protein [Actinoplanes sp.]|nr:CDP-alcohol phosphatidyltransferase family protein [Actinoplanes sp.]